MMDSVKAIYLVAEMLEPSASDLLTKLQDGAPPIPSDHEQVGCILGSIALSLKRIADEITKGSRVSYDPDNIPKRPPPGRLA